jgi:hypothetical protein
MVKGTEEVSETVGERALGNRKLGLEVRHADEGFKVVFQLSQAALSKGIAELLVTDGDSQDAQTITDDGHGGWESQATEGSFRNGGGVGAAFLIA